MSAAEIIHITCAADCQRAIVVNIPLGVVAALVVNKPDVYAVAKCLVIAVRSSVRNAALCLLAWHEIVVAVFPCQLARVGDINIYLLAVCTAEECVVFDLFQG